MGRLSKKKVTEHKMCILSFSKTFVRNISHSKNKWARHCKKCIIGLYVKYLLFLSDLNETWIFSTDFRKILISKLKNSVSWDPSCSMRTDRRTDMTKLIVAFRGFANTPKSRRSLGTCGNKLRVTSFSDTHKLKWILQTIPTTSDYILLYNLLL
jgi:hypothetical protein